jgi:hypothetical protein
MSYVYNPVDHFRSTLARVQGKDDQHVPDAVLNHLETTVYTEDITLEELCKVLKEEGMSKYLNLAPFIWRKVTKGELVVIDLEQEEAMCSLFETVLQNHKKLSEDCRVSIPGFNFMAYRIAQELGYHEIAEAFPKVASRSKRKVQEQWWQSVTSQMN